MFRPDQPLHGNGAQISNDEIRVSLERLGRFGIERNAEATRVVREAEKDFLANRRECARFIGAEQRIGSIAAPLHHHQFTADRECSGAWVGFAGGEKHLVAAALGDARQNALRVAEQRLRPEIGARGHG